MLLLLLACAKTPPPPTVADLVPTQSLRPKECTALLGIGESQRQGGEVDTATETWTEGYNRCGPGFGFLGRLASLRLDAEPDTAVLLAARELTEAGPFGATVHLVVQNAARTNADSQARLRALGETESTALRMPDMGAAIAWMRLVVCAGESPTITPAPAGDGRRIQLTAECGGTTYARQFVLRDGPPGSPTELPGG